MSLEIRCSASIDSNLLGALQAAGRRVGLSLDHMELLGQDVTAILGFLDAVDQECVSDYLDTVDWDALEARLNARLVFARA